MDTAKKLIDEKLTETKGYKNAIKKIPIVKCTCQGCQTQIPRYPGKYPKNCPECNAALDMKYESIEDAKIKAYFNGESISFCDLNDQLLTYDDRLDNLSNRINELEDDHKVFTELDGYTGTIDAIEAKLKELSELRKPKKVSNPHPGKPSTPNQRKGRKQASRTRRRHAESTATVYYNEYLKEIEKKLNAKTHTPT